MSPLKRSKCSLIFAAVLAVASAHAQASDLPSACSTDLTSPANNEQSNGRSAGGSPASNTQAPNQDLLNLEKANQETPTLDGYNLAKLSILEKRYFEHDFPSDKVTDRLARLEQLIFGATIPGDASKRLNNLATKTNPEVMAPPAEISRTAKPAPVTFQSAMDNGIKNYKLQRYHHAQEDFEKAIALNPRSAEAYANLGGVLIMLKDRENAREAFKACFTLHPFGELGNYAKTKMLKLIQEEAYLKTNPQDTPTTVQRSSDLIDRQVADRARMYQERAGSTAGHRLHLTNIQIEKLLGNDRYGVENQQRNYHNQDVSNLDYIRSNYLRSDGIVQANLALIDGNKKSTAVFESGTNLKDQMLKPTQPGGAKLRALGTSLYARYYGEGLPSQADPPMQDPLPAQLQATAVKARQ